MASNIVNKKRDNKSDDFPKYCEYGCGKYFDTAGNNDNNYTVHTKHCKKRPKQAKNNLLNYFSKNTDFDTEVVTDGTDQVVEVANMDIDDENNIVCEEERTGPTLECSTATRDSNEDKVCKGFTIKFESDESFFRIYPFHRHCSDESSLQLKYNVSITYDNASKCDTLVAHSTVCNRRLCDPDTVSDVNKCCSDIQHSPNFKKMLEMSSKNDLPSHSKLEMYNYQQLQSRYRTLKGQYNDEKLQRLNLLRKNNFLNQKCTLNSRFIELISSADIPRLKTLLQVCIRKGMGMKSILGRIEDAVNKRYSPKVIVILIWRKQL